MMKDLQPLDETSSSAKRVYELFEKAQGLSPQEAKQFLENVAPDEPALRAEVEALLEAGRSSGDAFERPLLPRLVNELELRQPPALPEPGKTGVLPRPVRVGNYLLLKKLGQGGMAEVFLARSEGAGLFHKYVALKRVLVNYAAEEHSREIFTYEAKLSSLLTHPNIIQVHDFSSADNQLLLAMEYVPGRNLLQLSQKLARQGQPVPLDLALFVLTEMLNGLDYAHDKTDPVTGASLGIVHRDITPRNVMVSYDGAVKILDFGIAKAMNRAKFTQSGMVRGTMHYISPEIAMGREPDRRSDIFSAAILLYELLTGKELFGADNFFESLRLIEDCQLPATKIPMLRAPDEIKRILLRALARDPDDRYQTAEAFRADIQAFLEQNFSAWSSTRLAQFMQLTFSQEIAEEQRGFQNQGQELARPAPLAPAASRSLRLEQRGRARDARPSGRRDTFVFSPLVPNSGVAPLPSRGWVGLLAAVVVFMGIGSFAYAAIFAPRWAARRSRVEVARGVATAPETLPQLEAEAQGASTLQVGDASAAPQVGERCRTRIESQPSSAAVAMDGMELGATPLDITVRCGVPIELDLHRPGYSLVKRKITVWNRDSRLVLALGADPLK